MRVCDGEWECDGECLKRCAFVRQRPEEERSTPEPQAAEEGERGGGEAEAEGVSSE